MEFLQAGLGIVGLGMSIFGGMQQSSIAKQEAGVSAHEFATESQENDVRRQAMEMQGRRNQIETLRVAQRARAMAVQAGTNQGANKGSGMIAGAQHTTSEGLYGLQGINNNLSFGRTMFGLDSSINADKSQLSQLQSQMATAQGWSSLGGAVMKSGGMVGNIVGQAGGAFNNLNWLSGGPTGFLNH